MKSKTNKTGTEQSALVLLAHGSRDERWRRPFEQLRRAVQTAVAPRPVTLCYLQFCPPTLSEALRQCAEQGAHDAVVIPVFMSGGGHLLRDVPDEVARAAKDVPGLTVRCTSALAEEPEVVVGMVAACARLAGDTP